MPRVKQNYGKERISFFNDSEFAEKMNKIAAKTNMTLGELTRKALDSYFKKIEKERIRKELETGYHANSKYYLDEESEWQYADKEKKINK